MSAFVVLMEGDNDQLISLFSAQNSSFKNKKFAESHNYDKFKKLHCLLVYVRKMLKAGEKYSPHVQVSLQSKYRCASFAPDFTLVCVCLLHHLLYSNWNKYVNIGLSLWDW